MSTCWNLLSRQRFFCINIVVQQVLGYSYMKTEATYKVSLKLTNDYPLTQGCEQDPKV